MPSLTLENVMALLDASSKSIDRSKIVAYYLINMILKMKKNNSEKTELIFTITRKLEKLEPDFWYNLC